MLNSYGGPDLVSLKGKTVRSNPSSVRTQIYNIPSQIMQQYRDVTLSVDIMKVNNIPFFMTIYKHITLVYKIDRKSVV